MVPMNSAEEKKHIYDLIVIGGGASGMMAASVASSRGLKVLLLEKNKKVGEKLRITGGGRCNILNAEEDTRTLLKKYGTSEQELYSLFSFFGMKEAFTFFTDKGLDLVVEAGKRAFPKSQKAEDVVSFFLRLMKEGSVVVKTATPVTRISTENGCITSVSSYKEVYEGKEYVFATGSVSHKETGSTGDGFSWLSSLGHTIIPPTPTIVPILVKEKWVKDLAGVSLNNVKITLYTKSENDSFENKIKECSLSGRILFTHFGLSGPLILNNAYKISDLLHKGMVIGTLDSAPEEDYPAVAERILQVFDMYKNKSLKNIIKEFVPHGMHKGVAGCLEEILDISTKVHSVTKEDRKKIVTLLKALPFTIEGLMGFDRAVVADGGVPLKEIDTKTMRSHKIKNLFITGDLLHINRPSGGYSLQLCWSTGYIAGMLGKKEQ
jgi:predicted Rossmann fold flavoprotein